MGKIADAIDEIEAELEDAIKEIQRLEKVEDALKDQIAEDTKLIEQYDALLRYLDENYPGVVTAFEVVQRMEK